MSEQSDPTKIDSELFFLVTDALFSAAILREIERSSEMMLLLKELVKNDPELCDVLVSRFVDELQDELDHMPKSKMDEKHKALSESEEPTSITFFCESEEPATIIDLNAHRNALRQRRDERHDEGGEDA